MLRRTAFGTEGAEKNQEKQQYPDRFPRTPPGDAKANAR
jgi:hypothetical protein